MSEVTTRFDMGELVAIQAGAQALIDATERAMREAEAGIWISRTRLMSLPMFGPAWDGLEAASREPVGRIDLSDQDSMTNVCIMAKALVSARTGDTRLRCQLVWALREVANVAYEGRALALGRELAAYVIAADLIRLRKVDPALDGLFRAKIRELLTTPTVQGPGSLVECHELRPNNWGTHAGASRAAVAAYLGDRQGLTRCADVFRGYLGDRDSYVGFVFGGPWGSRDHSWEHDEAAPVGINPAGATNHGHSIDGVLPDDQRRGGSFTWPPPCEGYVWEALQGALAQAVILHRAGYPVWDWEDRALLRAVEWLYEQGCPATGDDTWQPHVVNHYYGTSFPTTTPARAGKNVGWTDWTHGSVGA